MTHPAYGVLRQVTSSAAVVLQRNPGPMSLEGTNTWLLRHPDSGRTIVVDPGQSTGTDTSIDGAAHLDTLLAAAPDVELALVTHGHHDHSELAAALHERTGVPVRAFDPQHCHGGQPLVDGERLSAAGLRVGVLATPGHTSDSLTFVLEDAVLTGDTVLGRGTTVVAHPDGNLTDYLASLELLRGLGPLPVLPGHGPDLPDLAEVARRYLTHRRQRLDQVRAAVADLGADATPRQVVEVVYADVDQELWWAAELSVRAQLDYLRAP